MEIRKIMSKNELSKVFDVRAQDWMDDMAWKCNHDCTYYTGSGWYNSYGCTQHVDGKVTTLF